MERITTAIQVKTITRPGRHSVGDGLYLRVRRGGSRQWVVMWAVMARTLDGKTVRKQTELSLGPAGYPEPVEKAKPGSTAQAKGKKALTLAEARVKAALLLKQRQEGIDPKAARRKPVIMPSFGEVADQYIEANAAQWHNAKHVQQWRNTLGDDYCKALRRLPVDKVDTDAVVSALAPMWDSTPVTAQRIRGRIERVIASAIVRKLHPGPNPAVWRGYLSELMKKHGKGIQRHHASMPYQTIAAFMAELHACPGAAERALEFLILTAARSNEVLGAKWKEIDWDSLTWRVPEERMKTRIAHRVPLSPHAVGVLKGMPEGRPDAYIFTGNRSKQPLYGLALRSVLGRMGRKDATVHGFRSSFRVWAAERTSFPDATAEHALAHRLADKTVAAYLRTDELERRRDLMAAWGAWCFPAAATNVVTLTR